MLDYRAHGSRKFKAQGVMADDIEEFRPDAVSIGRHGFKMVDYNKLGIEMKEAA